MTATYPEAMLLGAVEGLTEFLPVSSTGHLILVEDLLGIAASPGKVFEVAIQLGAILAVCWIYRKRLVKTAAGVLARDPAEIKFAMLLLFGFLPAMVLGAAFHGFIKTHLFSPYIVSVSLLLGGIAILVIERLKPPPRIDGMDHMRLSLALKIGFCQAVAMIPGVSRSGATILGAMLLGVERKTAAEFSFFLAIPTMFAATVFDLFANRHELHGADLKVIGFGFATAFFVALLVVRMFLAFISRFGFAPFAWYRIVVGAGMLALILQYS